MRRIATPEEISGEISERLRKQGVKLTVGGEPTYVPVDFSGAEWYIIAVGPTKLKFAYKFAAALMREAIKGGVVFYSPGKSYPGEVNPRWALNILWNRDGTPLCPGELCSGKPGKVNTRGLNGVRKQIAKDLGVDDNWLAATDPLAPSGVVWVLPLDHNGKKWTSDRWPFSRKKFTLVGAEGPAGLRLPLNLVPKDASKRALVLEVAPDGLHLFFPPLLQPPFLELLGVAGSSLMANRFGHCIFEGYIPSNESGAWNQLSLTADPGVLEVNLPPCGDGEEYRRWLAELEAAAAHVGMRSYKEISPEESLGTGGGNHILFGGPSLEENAFFRKPAWITSILRYWQHHPSLSYLFTGSYVGPSSQAPRPDESSRSLYDLEMAYRFLENLRPGDNRDLISQTLRHLHIDGTGNTHRSEVSFDKFWNVSWEGGCRGLIEFRAVESLPHAEWMSHVALLWQALAAMLLEKPFTRELVNHESRLHDYYFQPTLLLHDFEKVLHDLRQSGYMFGPGIFEKIWAWRFPEMLSFAKGEALFTVRKALEGWPLLCETPLEGGSTSRFVDTSIERLELKASAAFVEEHRVFAEGREIRLNAFPAGMFGAGLRYRRTALNPSLHPGIPPHMPLHIMIVKGRKKQVFELRENQRHFKEVAAKNAPGVGEPCKKLHAKLLTYDLRLP